MRIACALGCALLLSGTGCSGGGSSGSPDSGGQSSSGGASGTGGSAGTGGVQEAGSDAAADANADAADDTGTVPPGADEPVYDPSLDTMVFQDDMDEYTDMSQLFPPCTQQSTALKQFVDTSWGQCAIGGALDPADTIVPGRSGNALQVRFGGANQESHGIITNGITGTDGTHTVVVQYWAKISSDAPLTGTLAVKWAMLWHTVSPGGASTRIQFNTHDHLPCPASSQSTYWQVYDQAQTACQGNQPVGPYFNDIMNDGKWHRYTYEFKPNSASGARDGMARMWVDGAKVIDIESATIGVTPAGGEKTWCEADDVDALAVQNGIGNVELGGPQTTVTPAWNYAVDDFAWWTINP